MPDARCRMLDAGCRMPDAGCWMLGDMRASISCSCKKTIFHFPYEIYHLSLKKAAQSMTNDKFHMENGKSFWGKCLQLFP
jgi:hypothetical protein